MRRLLITVLSTAVLAGCSVELEGAACSGPGDDDACPAGQLCGVDGKCAKNAVTECPSVAAATELAVDPLRGSALGNGATTPPACRYRVLADALATADLRNTAIAVRVYGGSGTTVLEAGPGLPLVVAEDVTLTTDSSSHDPSRFTISASQGTGDILQVQGRARVEGFTIVSATADGNGIDVVCGGVAGETATLEKVVVDGQDHLARGVRVAGACSLDATSLEVTGATGAGLFVAATAATAGASVDGGSIHDNAAQGILVNRGVIVLQGGPLNPLTVVGNVGGVHLEQIGGNIDASLQGLRVTDNLGVGLNVRSIATSKVVVTSTVFARNAFTEYGPAAGLRKAGGVLIYGTKPPGALDFVFEGNAVCHNGDTTVDEVAFYSSDSWSISGGPSTCTVGRMNGFTSRAADGTLVYSVTGAVDAQYNLYDPDPPDAGGFSVNVDFSPTCGSWLSPPVDCQ